MAGAPPPCCIPHCLSPRRRMHAAAAALSDAGHVARRPPRSALRQMSRHDNSSKLQGEGSSPEKEQKENAAAPQELFNFGSPTPGESHIIFVETSCALTDFPDPVPYDSASGLRLSPRAACAVESAARAHPDRRVYVLHTCTVRREALIAGSKGGGGGGGDDGADGSIGSESSHRGSNRSGVANGAPAFALATLALPNVRLWQQRLANVFADTPLESWLQNGPLKKSSYPVIHAADTLRFVVLWKYGGTYLDTDVLMLRSLGASRDFSCPESSGQVSIGAMDMSVSGVGHQLASLCLSEEMHHFKPSSWADNGPGAITRALKLLCNAKTVSEMSPERCHGYKILPSSAFYPIHYSQWRRFFREEGAEMTMAEVRDCVGVHVWNALSHAEPVFINSRQPYAQLARRVCPSVVAALNGTM